MSAREDAIQALLSGKIDRAVIQDGKLWIAWTKTWEGPPRPDYAAASADLRDYLSRPRRRT